MAFFIQPTNLSFIDEINKDLLKYKSGAKIDLKKVISIQNSLDCCSIFTFNSPKKDNASDEDPTEDPNPKQLKTINIWPIIQIMKTCCFKFDQNDKCVQFNGKCDKKYEDRVKNFKIFVIIICVIAIVFDGILYILFYKSQQWSAILFSKDWKEIFSTVNLDSNMILVISKNKDHFFQFH